MFFCPWKYEDGFDENGFDKDGFDKDGFDKNGFDKNGFDIDGFDKDCFHEDGFNVLGYDKNGFDTDGYDKDGVQKDGFDESSYPDYSDINTDWDTNDYNFNDKNDYSSDDRYIFFLIKLFYSLDKLKPKTKTKIQNIFWWCKWKFDFFLHFEWGYKKTFF